MEPNTGAPMEREEVLKKAYLLQAGGAAVAMGFWVGAIVRMAWGKSSSSGPVSFSGPVLLPLLGLLFVLAWIILPFAVLHLSTRLLRAYRGSVATLFGASIFLDLGSFPVSCSAFLAPPEGGSMVFGMLPPLQLVVLVPFLVVAWVRSWRSFR